MQNILIMIGCDWMLIKLEEELLKLNDIKNSIKEMGASL